jgi:mono/diheme cytochrome c family protein
MRREPLRGRMPEMRKSLWIAVLTAALLPLTARAEVDKKTERTWKAKCASCHGADGKAQTDQGTKMGIPDYTSPAWQKANTDDALKKGIAEGVSREKDGKKQEMEPFKEKLPPEQIASLVAYLRTFK